MKLNSQELLSSLLAEDTSTSWAATKGASEGMLPWKPDTIALVTDYNFEDDLWRIVAEARWSEWDSLLYYVLHMPREAFEHEGTREFADNIYKSFLYGFRFGIKRVEPEDNIILGSN